MMTTETAACLAIRRTSSIVETVDIPADFQFQRVVEGIGDGEEDGDRRDRKRKHARKVRAATNFSGNAFWEASHEMGKIGAWC